jgi:hypothetical protein
VLDVDLGLYRPGFRPFLVRGETWAYWTVYDGGYEPVAVADVYLRRLRFGSGLALGTTRMYASNLALFFEFCRRRVARCARLQWSSIASCTTWW